MLQYTSLILVFIALSLGSSWGTGNDKFSNSKGLNHLQRSSTGKSSSKHIIEWENDRILHSELTSRRNEFQDSPWKENKGLKIRKKEKTNENKFWPWRTYEEWANARYPQKSGVKVTPAAMERKSSSNKREMKHQGKNKNKKLKKRKSKELRSKNKVDTYLTTPTSYDFNDIGLVNDEARIESEPVVVHLYATGKKDTRVQVNEKKHKKWKWSEDTDNEIRKFYDANHSLRKSIVRASKKNFTSDENECLNNNGGCEGLCVNTQGSYYCHCPPGFMLDYGRTKCQDVNECLPRAGRGPCEGECENTWGGYKCTCDSHEGTELAQDGHSCVQMDKCRTAGCSHMCVTTKTGAFCVCPMGLALFHDGKTCFDINECLQIDFQRIKCKGECINTLGSYKCV